jgi:hypothetical protein
VLATLAQGVAGDGRVQLFQPAALVFRAPAEGGEIESPQSRLRRRDLVKGSPELKLAADSRDQSLQFKQFSTRRPG